ncbi:hypothetical protein GCM10009414_19100 [Tatumella terrea]
MAAFLVPLDLFLLDNSTLRLKYNQWRFGIKKGHFTESRILRDLKSVESGRHVKDVSLENGVSEG